MNKTQVSKEDQDVWLVWSKACQLGHLVHSTPIELLELVQKRLEKSLESSARMPADRLALIMIRTAIQDWRDHA
jgi:hypothetical protein